LFEHYFAQTITKPHNIEQDIAQKRAASPYFERYFAQIIAMLLYSGYRFTHLNDYATDYPDIAR
jgi:hypothetical protein